MGFGDNLDSRRERRESLSPQMERAYQDAQRMFKDPTYTIQMSEFKGFYDSKMLEEDAQLVDALSHRFAARNETEQDRNSKKMADAFEGMLLTHVRKNFWFGNAEAMKTSLFDDYINHADLLAELKSKQFGQQVLALNVDVTFGLTKINEKLTYIQEQVEKDKAGSIRYFRHSDSSSRGERDHIPHVVIGVSQSVVEELARLSSLDDKNALRAHPIQRILLEQIYAQLKHVSEYAHAHGKLVAEAAYAHSLPILEALLKEKSHIGTTLAKDPVNLEIMRNLKERFKVGPAEPHLDLQH